MGVTVTFVAILELVREGLIDIVQTEAYAPLHVRSAQGARGLRLAVDNDAQLDAVADESRATTSRASTPSDGRRGRRRRTQMEKRMSDAYLKNVDRSGAAGRGASGARGRAAAAFRRAVAPDAEGDARDPRAAGGRLRGPRRRHQGNRQRLPLPGAQRVRARSVAPVAGPPAQVFARAARDARAHRLSPADHARRDRERARRRRESRDRQDAHGAQLGARRRPSRCARASRAAGHHDRVPRLLLARSPSKTCRRSPSSSRSPT